MAVPASQSARAYLERKGRRRTRRSTRVPALDPLASAAWGALAVELPEAQLTRERGNAPDRAGRTGAWPDLEAVRLRA